MGRHQLYTVWGTLGPDPRVVIPIILKFGDALDELAARMAEQTGLPEFAAAARQRLGDGR